MNSNKKYDRKIKVLFDIKNSAEFHFKHFMVRMLCFLAKKRYFDFLNMLSYLSRIKPVEQIAQPHTPFLHRVPVLSTRNNSVPEITKPH